MCSYNPWTQANYNWSKHTPINKISNSSIQKLKPKYMVVMGSSQFTQWLISHYQNPIFPQTQQLKTKVTPLKPKKSKGKAKKKRKIPTITNLRSTIDLAKRNKEEGPQHWWIGIKELLLLQIRGFGTKRAFHHGGLHLLEALISDGAPNPYPFLMLNDLHTLSMKTQTYRLPNPKMCGSANGFL